MKIEKLTENKIRVVINSEDLDKTNIDLHSLMTKNIERHVLLSEILEKAESEYGFDTDGCKLLIEAFSSHEDFLVFTITKYSITEISNAYSSTSKKKVLVKRKSIDLCNKLSVYSFENFDGFCNFCNYINNMHEFDTKKLSKNISLYLYNNTYYLLLKNINTKNENLKKFYSLISEFAKLVSSSESFSSKLLEYGKPIMKKDAINTGIKYFAN